MATGYEEFYVQGHNTMYTSVSQPTFRRNVPSPASRVEEYTSTKKARIISDCYLLQVTLLVCLFCGPEQGNVPPKRLLTSNRLHSVTFHKRQLTNIYHGVNVIVFSVVTPYSFMGGNLEFRENRSLYFQR
jgi:hypothetical protein